MTAGSEFAMQAPNPRNNPGEKITLNYRDFKLFMEINDRSIIVSDVKKLPCFDHNCFTLTSMIFCFAS